MIIAWRKSPEIREKLVHFRRARQVAAEIKAKGGYFVTNITSLIIYANELVYGKLLLGYKFYQKRLKPSVVSMIMSVLLLWKVLENNEVSTVCAKPIELLLNTKPRRLLGFQPLREVKLMSAGLWILGI